MAFDDVRGRGFKSRAGVDDVIRWIDARPAPLPTVEVPLRLVAGRVLGRGVASPVDVPAFRRAAMDGWAVRGADTFGATDSEPQALRVVGESRPGAPPAGPIEAGEAVRIRTGAPMPEGADAVLPAEHGEQRGASLAARGEVPPGRNVGEVGEDVASGAEILPAGRVLRPQDVALLCAIGSHDAPVVRSPRVGIVATGEEILTVGAPREPFRVHDANTLMLRALVARDGGVDVDVETEGFLAHGLDESVLAKGRADVLLVTGGTSVGPEDDVPALVAKHGELVFHGIAMRPSSPTGVGVVRDTVVFLLPGNPVSCLCAYDFFAGRLVRRLAGRSREWPHREVRLPLARKVVSELGRVDYLRVRVVDGRVEPLTSRGAAVLSTTTRADGFVVVPRDVEGWPEGTVVGVRLYDA